MARPFEIALEEDSIVSAQISSDNTNISEVIEEGQEVEEEVAINKEVDEQVEALEEASEEADAMLDQVETNEQKIQDDEQGIQEVTDEDVVTSEENFKYSLTRFGYDEGLKDVYSLANEAKSNGYSNRKRLEVSTEGIGDFIAKVISSIKTLIKRIVISCKKFFAKLMFKFGRYEKRITLLIKRLEGLKKTDAKLLTSAKFKDAAKKFGKLKGAESYFYDFVANYKLTYSPAVLAKDQMTKFEALSESFINEILKTYKGDAKSVDRKSLFGKIWDRLKAIFKSPAVSKLTDYVDPGSLPKDYSKETEIGVIGRDVYYIPTKIESRVIKKFRPLWRDMDFVNEVILRMKIAGVVTTEIAKLKNLLQDVKSAKSVFKTFDDNQDKYLKYLKDLENKFSKEKGNHRSLKIGLDLLRVGAAEINLYAVRKFVYDVRTNVKIASLIANLFEDAEV